MMKPIRTRLNVGRAAVLISLLFLAPCALARNVLLFVADGLRPSSVNPVDAPTLTALAKRGVRFTNSHSLFPTITMVNAAGIATGHLPGDTGILSNSPWLGYHPLSAESMKGGATTPTPFIEDDRVLAELAAHFGGSPLGERTLLDLARSNGLPTAAIGKLGPTALQDVTQIAAVGGEFPTPQTIIIDDSTGRAGIPLGRLGNVLRDNGLPPATPTRVQPAGDAEHVGAHHPNWGQQAYYVEASTRAVLPELRKDGKPFVMVYWSRDPDGTQHTQGEAPGKLWPGINGEISQLAIRNADRNLRLLLDWLREAQLLDDTDIFVTSDHGFATLSKQRIAADGALTRSPSASQHYDDVRAGQVPTGFVAVDLALALDLPLYDAGAAGTDADGVARFLRLDPKHQHPAGSALLGGSGAYGAGEDAALIVVNNGGSDTLYLPHEDRALLERVVAVLARSDYTASLFVADRYGDVAGTLPFSAIGLQGEGKLPAPALVVSFKSFALPAGEAPGSVDALHRSVQFGDDVLQQGQGTHGGFGRESTYNFMLAAGPDFQGGAPDPLPVSNADIEPTLAEILGLPVIDLGKLRGRILHEALRLPRAAPQPRAAPRWQSCRQFSAPAADGRRTILKYQLLDDWRYFDTAEFRRPLPGETAGCRRASK